MYIEHWLDNTFCAVEDMVDFFNLLNEIPMSKLTSQPTEKFGPVCTETINKLSRNIH